MVSRPIDGRQVRGRKPPTQPDNTFLEVMREDWDQIPSLRSLGAGLPGCRMLHPVTYPHARQRSLQLLLWADTHQAPYRAPGLDTNRLGV